MARRSAGFRELSTPIFSHEVFKATGQGTSETRNHCDPKPLAWRGRQDFDLDPGVMRTIRSYCREWGERQPGRNASHQSAPYCTSRR